MDGNLTSQELRRVSLAITCRWISISFALHAIGTIAKKFAESKFLLSDPRTWLPLLESLASWGIIPLLAVFFSQLACYFWPDNSSINNLERFMARVAIFASAGFLLLIPMYIATNISTGQTDVPLIAISCFRCFALSLGFLGASRTRNSKGSPFLRNSVESPIDYWLRGEFDQY